MDLDKLLRAAQLGERWAGPALVTLLMPTLIRYAEDIGEDLSSADREIAVEQAILRAVEKLERFDGTKATFPTWVRGFLRHSVLDIRRKVGSSSPISELGNRSEQSREIENAETEVKSALTWSLLELSVTDQVIISLRDFEGLTYFQCAERIGGGVSESACRVRHHRALDRLETLLRSNPLYNKLFQETDNE
jgi:RNA polymerase sigma factor (sigma-70 family)